MGKIFRPSNPQGDGYYLLSLQPTSHQLMGKIFIVPLTHMVMGIISCRNQLRCWFYSISDASTLVILPTCENMRPPDLRLTFGGPNLCRHIFLCVSQYRCQDAVGSEESCLSFICNHPKYINGPMCNIWTIEVMNRTSISPQTKLSLFCSVILLKIWPMVHMLLPAGGLSYCNHLFLQLRGKLL
jgi:hypothetical protein